MIIIESTDFNPAGGAQVFSLPLDSIRIVLPVNTASQIVHDVKVERACVSYVGGKAQLIVTVRPPADPAIAAVLKEAHRIADAERKGE